MRMQLSPALNSKRYEMDLNFNINLKKLDVCKNVGLS